MRVLLLTAALLAPRPAGAQTAPYEPPPVTVPPKGALLPWHRVVTYYGNPLSKRMGILGEIPPPEMMDRLERQTAQWQAADPATKTIPALELVATVASDKPGPSGLYRTRMSDELIRQVIGWARSRGWITILDVQVGHSTVLAEVERMRPFLEEPDVHLALDPEFDMPGGAVPGKRIGTTDGKDVNVAVGLLASIVEAKGLPPKLLLVHRFTTKMLTGHSAIRRDPRVQVVIVMDGFGHPGLKRRTYSATVRKEPVQYAGIKLFYKNDKPLMTPEETLRLKPGPSVVIYQ